MLRYFYTICFVFYVGLVSASNLISYTNLTILHTDRMCYVSGDHILVKAYNVNASQNSLGNENVLYIDIVNNKDQFINGEILKLQNGLVSGFIQIPDSVKTGYYSLRAYTFNSINNSDKQVLKCVQIYVTNRFGSNSERLSQIDNRILADSISMDDVLDRNCSMNIDNTNLQRRSRVSVKVALNKSSEADKMWADLSVKLISEKEAEMVLRNKNTDLTNTVLSSQLYAPNGLNEDKGIIISGKAKHKITGMPLANYAVLLAFEDSILRLKYSITDKEGKFSFLLNDYYGSQMVYLSIYTYPTMEIYHDAVLTIDNKYLSTQKRVNDETIVGYEISADSLNVLKSIISKAYNISYFDQPFYKSQNGISYEQIYLAGELNQTVNMDDYVDLPDFYQIAREILPFVKLRNRANGYVFYINDGINNIVRQNPMVFVDGVPLTNNENIIKWGTNKIKMVQVQIEPRYFGDLAFENGMIFIWTRKLNFWETDENSSTQKFLIQGYQKPVNFNFPDYSKNSIETRPDFRQILYWEPNVTVKNNEPTQFEFYTSDEVGTYEVILRGLSNTNEQVYIRKLIHVK